MKTRVVNIRETDEYDFYIGRPGRGEEGYYGNPIRVGSPCPVCRGVHKRGGNTLGCFEEYARDRIKRDVVYRERVKELHGKTLGCFCKPKKCHGDILAKLAEELNNEV